MTSLLDRLFSLLSYGALFALLVASLNVEAPIFAITPHFLVERSSPFSPETLFVCTLLLATCLLLPSGMKKPSDFAVHVQFLFPVLPMAALFTRYELPTLYFASVVFAFWLMLALSKFRIPINASIGRPFSPIGMALLCLTLSIALFFYIILMGGLRYFNLNFWAVYEYRQAAADSLPSLVGYFVSIVSKVILPAAVVFAILGRSRACALLGVLLGALLFGVTGHKAILFYPLAAWLIFSFFSRFSTAAIPAFAVIIASAALIGLQWQGVGESLFILVSDRLFFIPAVINFSFFDWFSSDGNPFVYWTDSKISLGIWSYPYDLPVPFLIGREYFGSDIVGANTGWMGAGYANAGVVGVFSYGLFMGLILLTFNSLSARSGSSTVISVAFGALISPMLSSDIPNSFLSHGLLAAYIILASTRSDAAPFPPHEGKARTNLCASPRMRHIGSDESP